MPEREWSRGASSSLSQRPEKTTALRTAKVTHNVGWRYEGFAAKSAAAEYP